MLATQKACSALSKGSVTQLLRRHLMEASTVGSSKKEVGHGVGGMDQKLPGAPQQQKPVIDETLDRRDEAHDVPWRDGISGITHLYDMEEAKSLQQ